MKLSSNFHQCHSFKGPFFFHGEASSELEILFTLLLTLNIHIATREILAVNWHPDKCSLSYSHLA